MDYKHLSWTYGNKFITVVISREYFQVGQLGVCFAGIGMQREAAAGDRRWTDGALLVRDRV
jgi:hypothetical protein